MSKQRFVVIGHLSIDKIRNPYGEREQLGGAALYTAAGAAVFLSDVRIISSVGSDYKELKFLYSKFPKSIIKRVKAPSTYFEIEYDKKWRAYYKTVRLGAGAYIRSDDLPSYLLRGGNTYIHLAPMRPKKMLKFVERIRSISDKVWVSATTSPDYLQSSENKRMLTKLMQDVDLFVLNEHEARKLAGVDNLALAVNVLNAKRLAITLGHMGAIIAESGKYQLVPALSGLVQKPRDTTGAGDTWCGSLVATYMLTDNWITAVITACIVSALKCLDWGVNRIASLKFNTPEDLIDYILSIKDKSIQLSLTKFTG